MNQSTFSIMLLCAFLCACESSDSTDPNAVNSTQTINFASDPSTLPADKQAAYNGQGIELTNAWEVIDEDKDNHSLSEVHISDGTLRAKRFFFVGMEENAVYTWDMTDANIWVNALLYSSDLQALDNGVYIYIESPSNIVAGSNFFALADVYVDFNQDQEFNTSERIDVTGGTLTVSGTSPMYKMDFDLVLENGASVNGTYSGNFTTRSQLPKLPFLDSGQATKPDQS